jgi:glucose-1-phosphate cytidylyltransferase
VKIIILAGGLGTRISEETVDKPKPMVLIGQHPILWHIINIFTIQGFNDFVISTGYKSVAIESWLTGLNGKIENLDDHKIFSFPNFKVTTFNSGLKTQTGGRIAKCMKKFPGERMIATYGDGLANISISKLLDFHESHRRLATVTAVRPPARFGYLGINDRKVTHFGEKSQADAGWINGGFFVLESEVSNYVQGDMESFEYGALPRLVSEDNLMAYLHEGFWQPMDTLREKRELEKLASLDMPPWFKID